MATIKRYQTAAGELWEVRYRQPNGITSRKRGFTTKRDAAAWASTVEVRKLDGEYVAPSLGRVTVAELAPAWLSRKESDVAKSNYRMLESAWRVHVQPVWGSTKIADVDPMRWSGGSPPCAESRLLPMSSEPMACWGACSMALSRLDGWRSRCGESAAQDKQGGI